MISRLLIFASLIGLTLFVQPAFAQNPLTALPEAAKNPIKFTPEVPIPGTYDATPKTIDQNGIAVYIKAIYVYFIWAVGILATVMVIYGGIRWVAAAGNPSRINDARETINNAIIGLIIALTSYALLYVINPQLLNLSLPDIAGSIKPLAYTGQPTVTYCRPSDRVACGDILKTGTAVSKDGQNVDVFCAGTLCQDPAICGLIPQAIPRDQQLTSEGLPYETYYQPSGCQTSVTVDNPSGVYATTGPLKAASDAVLRNSLDCNKAYGNLDSIGSDCSKPNEAYYNNLSLCYLIGAKAKLQSSTGDNDRVSNVACTPL